MPSTTVPPVSPLTPAPVPADGRQVLTLEERGKANVSGEGFLAGTQVYVWLFSEPTFLGELTVQADGTFAGAVSLEGIARVSTRCR